MKLRLPFDGSYVITQLFGENPQYYAQYGLPAHNGVDYGTPVGTPILAAADGFVMDASLDSTGYGLYVKVDHGEHYTLYAHLSVFSVEFGNAVLAGDQLGLSGNTGNSTGPHLHFGLRKNAYSADDLWRGWINPRLYIAEDEGEVTALPPAVGYGKIMTGYGLNIRSGAAVTNQMIGVLPFGLTICYYNVVMDGDNLWLDLGAGMFCAAVYNSNTLVDIREI